MSSYTIVKSGVTFQVVRNGTTLMTSFIYAGAAHGFVVYDWALQTNAASWTSDAAGPIVASFTASDQDTFAIFDTSLQSQVAQWNGSDVGTPLAGGGTTGVSGVFGDATHVAEVTVNSGVVTAASSVPISFPVLPRLSPSPAGVFGDATDVPQITVNAQGLVTSVKTVPIPQPVALPGSLFKPTSAAQWQAAWQAAVTGGYLLLMDPTTVVTDSNPIVINGVDFGQQPRGMIANGACFVYTSTGPAVTIKSGPVNGNRGMVLAGYFHIVGNDTKGSVGLYLNADAGAAIYKFAGQDIYIDGFDTGAVIEGNFFESAFDNWQIENCLSDGLVIADGPGQTVSGVISNIMLSNPNLSRNGGFGLHCSTAKSVDVEDGSFVNNTGGGIHGEQGIRKIDGPNFENCGPVAVVLNGASDTGCKVINCEFSNTANPQTPEFGGPMLFGIKYTGNTGGLLQSGNTGFNCTIVAP